MLYARLDDCVNLPGPLWSSPGGHQGSPDPDRSGCLVCPGPPRGAPRLLRGTGACFVFNLKSLQSLLNAADHILAFSWNPRGRFMEMRYNMMEPNKRALFEPLVLRDALASSGCLGYHTSGQHAVANENISQLPEAAVVCQARVLYLCCK